MTDTTPAAIEALEAARFEMEQVGAIGTMEDGTEVITMGVLLSGDEAAIKWAGKHIFSSVVLMRVTDHAALAAELTTARRERDEALLREAALLANNEAERKTLVAHNARHAAEAAALRGEVDRLTVERDRAIELTANAQDRMIDTLDRAEKAETAHAATKAALDEAVGLLTLIRDDGPSWQSDNAAEFLAKHGSQS